MKYRYVRYIIWADFPNDIEDYIAKVYKSRKHAIRFLKNIDLIKKV